MLVLGFNEFIRNIRKNILVIAQMIVVYIIALFTISAFEEQYRLMDGVSEVLDDTGMLVFNGNMLGDAWLDKDKIQEELIKVEKIEHKLNVHFHDDEFGDEKSDKNAEIIAYSSENISYIPKLTKGKWFNKVESEEGYINAVISDNFPFEVEIGQVVEHSGYKFKVIGIVSSKEMLYGINTGYGYDSASYLDYYSTWEEERKSGGSYLFMISYDDMINQVMLKENLDPNFSWFWGTFGFTTIDFEDDITEEEMQYNMSYMCKTYERAQGADIFFTKGMYDYSWELINIKIMPMLMLFIVIIVALVISLLISVAINVLYEKRNYGIYFVCGNNWSNTFKLSLVSWSVLAITSFVIAGCGYVVIGTLDIFNGLSVSFGWMHIAFVVAVTLILLLLTMIIPFVMLRKIQPVSILKANYK